jgi:DNA-binding NtrC family response regulator
MHTHFSVDGPACQEVLCVPVTDDAGRVRGVVQYLFEVDEILFFGAEDDPNRLVGWSSAFNRMMSLSYRVAREKTIVLLDGESGTQKRLVAAAIHRISGRQGPVITIDCGAVSAERFPLELAQHAGIGAVVGTLLLSRLDRAPLDLQAALLHMLRTGVAEPSSPVRVDVRILCATERDLGRLVRQGAFFEHLYYRVNVFPIRVPPLRERMVDLEPLVEHYLRLIDRDRSISLTAQAWARLRDYHYPGNLAQLRAILERACVVSRPGATIGAEHIEFGLGLGS